MTGGRKGTILQFQREEPPAPPVDRGPLMDAAEVARELLGGKVRPRWVRDHVPNKVVLGHSTVLWYRNDVLAWIASQRESA